MNTALVICDTTGIALTLFIALSIMLQGRTFDMDHGGLRYSFYAVFAVYRQIYAGIFVAGTVLSVSLISSNGYRVLLALSAVYALFFVLWLNFCYETYQRADGKLSYTGWKYAVALTLGAMSPLLFAAGLLGAVCAQ